MPSQSGNGAYSVLYTEKAKGRSCPDFEQRGGPETPDKAYMSYRVLEVADAALATPYIPFKSNQRGNPEHPLWHKLWALFTLEQGEFLRHYGQRQNSEAGFSSLKRVLAATIRAKNDRARINEALAVVVAYNLTRVVHAMFKLGVAPGLGSNGRINGSKRTFGAKPVG